MGEANGMRKLSKMRYAKPSKLKESWIEQNKQLLTNNLREISQEYENKISDEIGQIQKISDIPPVKERTTLKAEKTTNDYEISQNEITSENAANPVYTEIMTAKAENFPNHARILA